MRELKVAALIMLAVALSFGLVGCNLIFSKPPEAEFTVDPDSGTQTAPATVDVDASDSEDPDGEIISFAWDFGVEQTDSDTRTGETAQYTYDDSGTYTIQLTVTDNDGTTDKATKEYEVN